MSDQADRIRALLGSDDEAQRAQGRELLAALGDGALYATLLEGWGWHDQEADLWWLGEGEEPFSSEMATAIWLDAALDAPFPAPLAPERAARLNLAWEAGARGARADTLRRLARLPRLRRMLVALGEDGAPFPFARLPRRVRRLAVSGAARPEDLAGLAAAPGVVDLELGCCDLGDGPLPLPPRLARLELWSCRWGDIDLAEVLAGRPLRHLETREAPGIGPLAGLPGLRSLALDGLDAEELPPDLGALSGLERLSLFGGGLEAIPPSILALPRLRGLELGFNSLASLPGLGRLAGLRWLSLRGNSLEELPPEMAALRELRRLDLSSSLLRALPPWLPRLESLDLSRTPLEDDLTAEALLAFPALRTLCLSRRMEPLAAELVERARAKQGRRIALRLRWESGARHPLGAAPEP